MKSSVTKGFRQQLSKLPESVQQKAYISDSCPHCGIVMCRDQNAARNVKHRAVGHPVLKAHGGRAICLAFLDRNGKTAK
ncbi:MAG: hypothetical protein F6K24_18970 [Okeania sp. SIO2D1]|nr:hypothetical protein [Okeania sp. SIO2D1]